MATVQGIEFEIKGSSSEASNSVKHLIDVMVHLKDETARASTGTSKLSSSLKKTSGSANTLAKSLKKITASIGSGIGKALKFSAPTKELLAFGSAISGLANRFKRLLIMRTFRALIRGVVNAFKAGINNLYAWSNAIGGEFASSMDRCASATLYLKNSLGAMVAPLVNALAPALDIVIDKVVTFLNAISQLIAKLTGASYWTQATRQATSYGGAVEDAMSGAGAAAKEAMKYLAPFDELNVLPSDSGSGGGGGGGAGGGGSGGSGLFQEMMQFDSNISDFADKLKESWANADFTEVGTIVGAKLKTALDNIPWSGIQTTCNNIASSIATFINGFVATPELWTTVGSTIGNAINTAVGMWNTFFDTTNFSGIGSAIATALNTAIGTINGNDLGRALSQKIRAIIDLAYGFLVGTDDQPGFDFSKFGTWLGNAFNGFFSNIDLSRAGTAISTAITGMIDGAIAFISTTDFGSVAGNISDGITSAINTFNSWFVNVDWQKVISTLASQIYNAVTGVNWAELAESISTTIGSALGIVIRVAVQFTLQAWEAFKEEWDRRKKEYDGQTWKISLSFGGDFYDFLANADEWVEEHIRQPFRTALNNAFGREDDGEVNSVGEAIWNGFVDGIALAISGFDLGIWISTHIVKPIVDKIREKFEIHSPSKVMEDIGEDVGNGLLNGIANPFKAIGDWVQKNVLDKIQGAIDAGKDLVAGISAKVQLIRDGWEYVSSWIRDSWMGIAVSKGIGIARDGWDYVSSWIRNSWMGIAVRKGIGLMRDGWTYVSKWIRDSWLGSAVYKGIGIFRDGWYTVSGWIWSNWLGNTWIGQKINLYRDTNQWYTVAGWIWQNFMGSTLVSQAVNIFRDGWSYVSKWIKDKFMGNTLVSQAINLFRDGWRTVSGWIYDNLWVGTVSVGVSLFKSGWSTVTGWVNGSRARGGDYQWTKGMVDSVNGASMTVSMSGQNGQLDESAVYRAVLAALNNSEIGGDVVLDGKILYQNVVTRNKQNTRATGVNALA